MASSHGSLVRWNRAAEYYRKVNPALLRLRKAPERACAIHRATMTRPHAPGIALDCCQDCCQRGNRFRTPSDRCGRRAIARPGGANGSGLSTWASCWPENREGGRLFRPPSFGQVPA